MSSAVTSKRCCRSGSGDILLLPLSQGCHIPGAIGGDVCVETAGGGGDGAVFSDPSRRRSVALQ